MTKRYCPRCKVTWRGLWHELDGKPWDITRCPMARGVDRDDTVNGRCHTELQEKPA